MDAQEEPEKGICIASLDGGGPGSISQLLIINEILKGVEYDLDLEEGDGIRAADYWDLMGGVGFGGLCALLLGCLGMSVDDALEELVTIARMVFAKEANGSTEREANTTLLKIAVETMLERHQFPIDIKLNDKKRSNSKCKVVVFAGTTSTSGHPHPFRTYSTRQADQKCTFVEAACAILAAPEFFSPFPIGSRLIKREFVGTPLGFNNPTRQVLEEALLAFGDKRKVSLILSLGSGRPHVLFRPPNLDGIPNLLTRVVLDCERVASELSAQFAEVDAYLRLSVDRGMENVKMLDWGESELGSVTTHAEVYLNTPAVKNNIFSSSKSIRKGPGTFSLGQLSRAGIESTADNRVALSSIDVKQVGDLARDLLHGITMVDEMRMNKEASDALRQLPCSDARGNRHVSCLEGTRKNILRDIAEWATDSTATPIFALVDQAGTGKSTISTHMAQKWGKDGALIGRFFFSLPSSVITAKDLPTTLARDMADCGPSLRMLIVDAINDHPNITGYSIKEKLDWFVFKPLQRRRESHIKGLERVRREMQERACTKEPKNVHPEILDGAEIKPFEIRYKQALAQVQREPGNKAHEKVLEQSHMVYLEVLEQAYANAVVRSPIIVIDALDECTVVDRGVLLTSILSLLEEASLTNCYPLKIFITCRPEQDIISHFNDARYSQLIRPADLGIRSRENPSNHDDIAVYANRYLPQILSKADIHLFVTRANGLFIWASTARSFLAEALDPSTRFRDLLTPNGSISPLNSLYDNVLRSAVDHVGRDQVKLLKKVLQAICAAQEPFGTDAMDELLDLSNGVAYRVVSMLGSVLSGGTNGKAVQALHPTFIEYFRSGSQGGELHFSVRESEALLATGCLNALLSGQLRYDICNIMGLDIFVPKNQEIKDLQQRLERCTTPGLRYATIHGLSHVALCLDDEGVLMSLHEFFESNLLYWIEVMSFLGRIYHLMQSIHHLKCQISDDMTHPTTLLTTEDKDWCEEIKRLIQPFQSVIEESALQLYFSALPFAPPTSKISHFYHRRFIEKIPKVLRGTWRLSSQHIVLAGHTKCITRIDFSPDGRLLASGSQDCMVRLWDVETNGALGKSLAGHNGYVSCLSFSPDGRKLASGSGDDTLRLWDVQTGTAFGDALVGHTGSVECLSFSPDGKWLASGSWDSTVRLWDAKSGRTYGEPLAGHTGPVHCLSFSPDGRKLASGSYDGSLRVWDVEAGIALGEPLAGHSSGVSCLSFSPDGRRLASGSNDNTVRLWNAETGAALGEPMLGHNNWVGCVSFSPDGRLLESGSGDHTVRLWDVETGGALGEPLAGHTDAVTCVSFSPEGRWLASGSWDRSIRLWDVETGAAFGDPLYGHGDWVGCLSFSPDGRRLASGSGDYTVCLWDIEPDSAVGKPADGHSNWVYCISSSPDGRRLASGSEDHTICLWDAETGGALGEPLVGHSDWVGCLLFSPDGRAIASGSGDHTVRLWDVETGAAIGEPLSGHISWVRRLSFSPDGRFLASGSGDCTVRLWDVKTGAAFGQPLVAHNGAVCCLSFSPDGRILASGSDDLTVCLWDVETGASIGHSLRQDPIRSLSFRTHQAGSLLVINGTSAVWELSPDGTTRSAPLEDLPESAASVSDPVEFREPWTYIMTSPKTHFSLPSGFQCKEFFSSKGTLAYGGRDGSVIFIDCSHLI